MLDTEAASRIGRGGRKVMVATDRTPEELKHVIEHMSYRKMSAIDLAKMLGVSSGYVGQWLRGDSPVKMRDVYAIRYVLTHSYWDDVSNEWVVID